MTAALTSPEPSTTFRDLVAAELRAHLARRRISNRKLARILGTTPAWIDRRLNGTTPINTDDLELVGHALGMSPMQLLSGIANGAATAPVQGITTRRYSNDSEAQVLAFPQVRAALGQQMRPLFDRPGEPRAIA